jgi:hypothetical protein
VTVPITYAELGEILARAHFGVGASDLHGSLTGYLCGGGSADARHWLGALELEPNETLPEAIPPAVLERLYAECAGWLDDPELGFEPLLPPADTTLEVRADALVDWCRGFLGGLGLAGAGHQGALSAEAQEILRDFAAIAGTRFEYNNTEEDESALTEVVEFIRVGALLLHAELHAAPTAGATLH